MKIPFTLEQFLSVFGEYNTSIWPMQFVLYLVAIAGVVLILINKKYTDKIVCGILVLLWFWMGLVYHIVYFSSINKAAIVFGILFIIQGFLFLFIGVVKNKLKFSFETNVYGITSIIFILYALVIYPVLGYFFGHRFPESPTFGAPCPTIIFTFGLLLLVSYKVPKYLLIIPLIWSLIGFSAAINLQVKEDFGLVLAGIIGTILIFIKDNAVRNSLK